MGEIKIDLTKLNQKVRRAFDKTANAYGEQLQEEIRTPEFSWTDKRTKRQDGSVVGSPRDIVDTEDFVNSQQPVVTKETTDEIVATIEYTSDHAAVVYTGWVDAQDIYPGREWDKAAQQSLNLSKQFGKDLKKEMR